ncbi:MAG: DMT family transporter, partial [Hyphomonadaceae bacterium]
MPARSPGRLNPWGNAALLLSASSLFWAGNSIAGRLLADAVPPLTFTFWRWAVALLLITPFAWRHIRADAPALLRHWPMILGLAATGAGSFGALLYIGLQTTTALNSLVLQAAIPPIVLLLAVLILREKAGAAQMLGIAVSLIGVLVILTKGHLERLLSLSFNPGDAYILAAVLLNSGYSILLRFRPAV